METTPQPQPPLREPGPTIPPPPGRERNGTSLLERKALYRVQLEVAAMPASLVVQILLWPEKLTDWAREERVTPALVYNMLGGFKPYHDLRQRLAQRLGVAKGALDHLIDGRRPPPLSRRIPEPPADLASETSGAASGTVPADVSPPERAEPRVPAPEAGADAAEREREELARRQIPLDL